MAFAMKASREIYRNGFDPSLIAQYRVMTKQRMEAVTQEEKRIIDDSLAPEERPSVVTFIYPSSNHKIHHVHRVIGREPNPEFPNFPISYDPPDIAEEKINRRELCIESPVNGEIEIIDLEDEPAIMALCKASRLFPLPEFHPLADEVRIQNISEYLELLFAVNNLEANHLKPAYPLNRRGRHVLSGGHDVVVYQKRDGELFPLHQQPHLITQDMQFEYLAQMFCIGDTVPQPADFVLKSATAVYDVGLDFAALSRSEHDVHYDRMTKALLTAYVYGVNHPDVDGATRNDVMKVYNMFPQSGKQNELLFRGWKPESGVNVSITRKINGALLNQCPIIWLADSHIRNFLLSEQPVEALSEQQSLIDLVSGNPKTCNRLIRGILQVSMACETDEQMQEVFNTKQSQRFAAIAQALKEDLRGKEVMTSYVIDFTHYLDELRLTDQYVDALQNHFKRE